MIDLQAVNAATAQCVEHGIRVLNAYMLAATEQDHAAALLELMDPPAGALVLDAGCGIGELARLMAALRPDLTFKLLNVSQEQLAQCPEGMQRIHSDFARIPLPDESVDVVMFNFAICHADDWLTVFTEARRALREGGILFIFDMGRDAGDNVLMHHLVRARAFLPESIIDVAARAGLALHAAHELRPTAERLREVFPNPGLYEATFANVFPIAQRYVRRTVADPIVSAFARHRRVAFQFSGGRDSTAALYLLRPYWERLTLYHLDTGDQFPETRAVFQQVAQDFLVETGRSPEIIMGDVHAVRDQFGLASDLAPVDNGDPGRLVSGRSVKIIGRYECCARALMWPMHQRMVDDGITLIVRGQRDDEYATPPKRSGDVADGFEVLYPIQDWTAERVTAYLKDNGLPLAAFYERGVRRAPECMGCTAWWDEGRAAYLREHHPDAYRSYTQRMRTIRTEIDRQYAMLDDDHAQRN
jgi:ubiquinone/menaquinone biosynthesis C-methylase UbiE/3'-phosphoadenosine 5'-phosphosulfate sulfotransferase (PAPS reductase)/FAD synthetase